MAALIYGIRESGKLKITASNQKSMKNHLGFQMRQGAYPKWLQTWLINNNLSINYRLAWTLWRAHKDDRGTDLAEKRASSRHSCNCFDIIPLSFGNRRGAQMAWSLFEYRTLGWGGLGTHEVCSVITPIPSAPRLRPLCPCRYVP